MRLEGATFHNFGPFRDFEVDLTQYAPASVIAIVGPNGAGKSTFLESAIAGACFRATPTQGTLMERASARDSMVEARIANGRAYKIRHLLDAVSGKGEAVVLENGKPCFETTKVSVFDEWATRHLPPPEVLFNTVFAAQASKGFLGLGSGDRIGVILRVLGLQRYEVMAAGARERGRGLQAELEKLVARIADEQANAGDVVALGQELDVARANVAKADADVVENRAAVDLEKVRVVEHRENERRRKEYIAQCSKLSDQASDVAKRRSDLIERITNNHAVLADADAIRAAAARIEGLTKDLADAQRERDSAAASSSASRTTAQSAERGRNGAEARAGSAALRVETLEARLAHLGELEATAARIPEAITELAKCEEAWKAADLAVEQARGSHVAGKDERIVGLRSGLTAIAEAGDANDPEALRSLADGALERDDAAVKEAAEQPERLKTREKSMRDAAEFHRIALRDLEKLRRAESEAKALKQLPTDLQAAKDEAAVANEEAANHRLQLRTALAEAAEFDAVAEKHRKLAAAAADELAKLKPLAAKAEHLARAEARLAELEPQEEAAKAELKRIADALGALEKVPEMPPPNVAGAESAVYDAEARQRVAVTKVTSIEQWLEAANAAAERLGSLAKDRRSLETEIGDWARLAADLGRDGLQAAEIDGAGPELTALVNDLLQEAFGSRFTITIETARLSADGKKMVDECVVRVLDAVQGRDAEARKYSGGEKVILSEAVSLALSMLGFARMGIERPSIVRDESGAALDPNRARAHVAMLRRAAQITGAAHVLLVSHSREVQELCDARIEIGAAA